MPNSAPRHWIDPVELEDVQIKWAFSHFAGDKDDFNDEGQLNFTVILPRETAEKLHEEGWAVRELEPYEEGDEPQYILKLNISYRYGGPKVYFLKGNRKIAVGEKDIPDIKPGVCQQLDVIFSPSRWGDDKRGGISAYVDEMYVLMRENRFEQKYADYEEVR